MFDGSGRMDSDEPAFKEETLMLWDDQLYHQRLKRFVEDKPLHPLYQMVDELLQERFHDIQPPVHPTLILGPYELTQLHQAIPCSQSLMHEDLVRKSEPWRSLYIPMGLHHVSSLEAFLTRCHQALHPEGVLVASCLVSGTLKELAWTLTQAEISQYGGSSPRIYPFPTLQDLGDALHQAGFQGMTLDQDRMSIRYKSLKDLLEDIRSAAGSNSLKERTRRPSTRGFWHRVEQLYPRDPEHPQGLTASFNVAFITAWAGARSNPQDS